MSSRKRTTVQDSPVAKKRADGGHGPLSDAFDPDEEVTSKVPAPATPEPKFGDGAGETNTPKGKSSRTGELERMGTSDLLRLINYAIAEYQTRAGHIVTDSRFAPSAMPKKKKASMKPPAPNPKLTAMRTNDEWKALNDQFKTAQAELTAAKKANGQNSLPTDHPALIKRKAAFNALKAFEAGFGQ